MSAIKKKIKLVLYTEDGTIIGVVSRYKDDKVVGRHLRRKYVAKAIPLDELPLDEQKELLDTFSVPANIGSPQRRRGGPDGFEDIHIYDKPL